MKWLVIIIICVVAPLLIFKMVNKMKHPGSDPKEIFADSPEKPQTQNQPRENFDTPAIPPRIIVIPTNPNSPTTKYPSAADGSGNEFIPGQLSPEGYVEKTHKSAVKVRRADGSTDYIQTTYGAPRVENYIEYGFMGSRQSPQLWTKEFGQIRDGHQLPIGTVFDLRIGQFSVRRPDGGVTRFLASPASLPASRKQESPTEEFPPLREPNGGGTRRGTGAVAPGNFGNPPAASPDSGNRTESPENPKLGSSS